MRSFHYPGRSTVYARQGMVATSHPSASLTGIEILKAGGNAVDAAIAIAATLGVVEPAMTGVGGDCFALLHHPQKGMIALNASGRAPKAATTDWYARQGITALELQSPHAVTVPGAIDGWARLLSDHGTMSFAKVLAPAIEFAQAGFVVAPRVAWDWARLEDKINVHAGARQHLLKDGKPPREGSIMRFPAMARTLQAIADGGRDAFYKGEIAQDLVDALTALGGLHTMDDFAHQKASYVTPISARYGGLDIYELPPSNQGITALIMLNMLKHIDAYRGTAAQSALRYHILLEVARQAYAARDAFVADPDQAEVPVEHMLSAGFAEALARRIDPKKRLAELGPIPRPKGTDTVCFSVAGKDGMAVSFINSLYSGFGTAIVGAKSGVALHNRGQGFTLDPMHPNHIAPGKRPMHTLVPAFAMKDGAPHLAFGVMGAAFQPMGHVYVITGLADHGLDPQEAIDCPRIFFENDALGLEHAVPAEVEAGLTALGHRCVRSDVPWGGGQAVMIDPAAGVLAGASDARKDGIALGY